MSSPSISNSPATSHRPQAIRTRALHLVGALRTKGHIAYFAGGCVRDRLLGKEPKDYDIATDARPEEVREIFPRTALVGAHFGVVLVKDPIGEFEIATFRSDGEYRDGRHPENVSFATPEEDAQRRDFTVNGLFEDPVEEEVIDFVGGQADLEKQILRAIGDPVRRFREDHLRLLRAVRFATVLDFEIEPETFHAIRAEAPRIESISKERVRDEMVKILLHPRRLRGFDLLVDTGLMNLILPEIIDLQGCEQPPQFHPEGDVFIHTRLMLSLLSDEVSLPLVLSVLFHDIGKPATQTVDPDGRIRFNGHDKLGAEMTETILRRLKFSNAVIEKTVTAVACHMHFKDVQKMRIAKLKRMMARDTFDDEMALHRVDCLGSSGKLGNYEFLKKKEKEFEREPIIPPPLINGRDLMTELGWKPGPRFGKILEAVQNEQLEGNLSTREEALEWVKAEFAE